MNAKLHYDSFCPLCVSTIRFVRHHIKPVNVDYVPLIKSDLSHDDYHRATSDMLVRIESANL